MFRIGEALVGAGKEIAHIDLMVGDKDGVVGRAFANGLVNLSRGHTPLLSVIRPNLPPKPHVLIVPKVTVESMEDANKIFGPAQAAVAKAVADAVEEGILPKDRIDEWVIVASVFIHPEAKDYRKIYHFNYGATKLALKRAMMNYPPIEKVMYEKDRATHPIMGFRVPRLWMPPYLQIALDIPSLSYVERVLKEVPRSDRILLEVGTPLLKEYGVKVINQIRPLAKDAFIIADLKTLDVGQVEVDLAFNETADAVVCAGLAPIATIDKFIYEAHRLGIYAFLDMMGVKDPVKLLKQLKELPDVILLHRSIDVERSGKGKTTWDLIGKIKDEFRGRRLLIAVAGGITPSTAPEALRKRADIIIVGRYITQSKDVERAVREFLRILGMDADQLRVHVE